MSNKKLLLFSTLLSFGLLEFGLYLASDMEILKIERPSYSFDHVVPFWVNNNEHFGVWHPPNDKYSHHKSCFKVEYRSNSWGARDRERELESGNSRVVVLGDSFVEGYGVERDQRLSDILEKRTGMEHLNFGTSGHFGPTQYGLLYEHLATRFDHDRVIVAILPNNDFKDDSYEQGKRKYSSHYRPYYVGEYPNYQLIYHREDLGLPKVKLWFKYIRGWLREFTYMGRTYEYIRALQRYAEAERELAEKNPVTGRAESNFYDFTDKEFNLMRYSLERIVKLAGKRKVLFVTIPRESDFVRYDRDGPSPLAQRLDDLARSIGAEYLDLLPQMAQAEIDRSKYFLSCDDHWSRYGNETAADLIQKSSLY
jgi:lysophospholipase L1-like esterase